MRNFRFVPFKTSVIGLGFFLLTACSSLTTTREVSKSPSPSSQKFQHSHLRCLAQAIHGEARGETEAGKLLVGRVIATRVQYGYGKNYCEVVNAPRQFAPQKLYNQTSMDAAEKAHALGPNGITHFHSYPKRVTRKARFSTSPQCQYRGKVGGHWTFVCNDRRVMSSINSDDQ